MIIETLANTNGYAYNSGNACIVLGPSLPPVVEPEIPEFCICDYIQCQYIEKVFADPGGTDYWKNDKNGNGDIKGCNFFVRCCHRIDKKRKRS